MVQCADAVEALNSCSESLHTLISEKAVIQGAQPVVNPDSLTI